jgi:glutathione S-transferase
MRIWVIGLSPAGLMTVTDPTRRIPSLADDDGPVLTEAKTDDVADIAALAALRREAYEVAQPQFWRRAADAVEKQLPWLTAQVENPDVVSLVARSGASLDGYVFASVVDAPPVYDPGGLTGVVDDFAVADVGP